MAVEAVSGLKRQSLVVTGCCVSLLLFVVEIPGGDLLLVRLVDHGRLVDDGSCGVLGLLDLLLLLLLVLVLLMNVLAVMVLQLLRLLWLLWLYWCGFLKHVAMIFG